MNSLDKSFIFQENDALKIQFSVHKHELQGC